MKIFFKKNIISILFLFILLGYFMFGLFEEYKILRNNYEGEKYYFQECLNENNGDHSNCFEIIEYDAHTVFSTIFSVETILRYSCFIIPICFLIILLWPMYLEFKTKNIKYVLTRKKYNKYIWDKHKKIFFTALIIPVFLLITLLICYLFTGSWDLNNTLLKSPDILTIDNNLNNNLLKYYIFYFVNIYLLFVFIGNIGFFFLKKNNSFIVTLLCSFITYFFINVITEIIIGMLVVGFILGINIENSLNIFNFWAYHNIISMEFMFLFVCILVLVVIVVNYFRYRSKEDLFVEEE